MPLTRKRLCRREAQRHRLGSSPSLHALPQLPSTDPQRTSPLTSFLFYLHSPLPAALWYSTTNLQHFFRVSDAALRGALSFGGLVGLYFTASRVQLLLCMDFHSVALLVALLL